MKRFIWVLLLSLVFSSSVYAADQWDKTDPAGTESPSDIDSLIGANNEAVDRFLSYGRFEAVISRASSSTLTIAVGSVACSNSAGSIRQLRANTSATTVTWSDIDTGSEANSTTYYVYAVADTDATTFTIKISTSATAPSGVTYYKKLGSFYNNASGDITSVDNDNAAGLNAYDSGWFAVAADGEYAKTHNLGTTNILVKVYFASDSSGTAMRDMNYYVHVDVATAGAQVTAITATTLNVIAAAKVGYISNGSTTPTYVTSGYYRVMAVALE